MTSGYTYTHEDFNRNPLTKETESLGELLNHSMLSALFQELSLIPALIYCSSVENEQATTDIFGKITLKRIKNEDRIVFEGSNAHVHVQWRFIKSVQLASEPGYPKDPTKNWIGIAFFNQKNIELFSLWNIYGDQMFSDQILDCLNNLKSM